MKEVNLLLAQDKRFNFVGVRFRNNAHKHCEGLYNSKVYHYKTVEEFELGDLAVVDVTGEFKVVEVVELNCMLSIGDGSYKWIVQRVDLEAYEARKNVEEKVCVAINTMRIKQLRKEVETELLEKLGATEVKKLQKMVKLW